MATLFGQVTIRLPRFRCAACCGSESGIDWPPHCRSTPELDRLQAHLAALMTYRTAADLLEQMFPVDAAKHPETVRRHYSRKSIAPSRKLWTALRALNRYLIGQSAWLVNYAERHRAGLRVGTAITEGTANFLVNRRMNKSQQMRWSRRGADLLLQVRCAVYNGTLGAEFGQKFHPANDSFPPTAVAA